MDLAFDQIAQYGAIAIFALYLLYWMRETVKAHQKTITTIVNNHAETITAIGDNNTATLEKMDQNHRDDLKDMALQWVQAIREQNEVKEKQTAVIQANTEAQRELSKVVKTALSVRNIEQLILNQKENNQQ